ncbi:MAG: aryl-sulfate sulfotransferase [Acidimicrobiales bacterium]|nr:aryl-sulfate sulfotransferase [Acidimicrobiales bacterium]
MLRRLSAVLLAAALVAASCADDDSSTEPPSSTSTTTSTTTAASGDDATPPDDAITVTVGVESVDTSPLAARVTIESTVPVTVQITATADDHEVATPVTAASATTHDLPLVGMRADRDYVLALTLTDVAGNETTVTASATTGPLPDMLPVLDIVSDPERSSPGITILELNTVSSIFDGLGAPIVGVDEDGEYVWYYNSGTFSGAAQRTPAGGVAFQHDPFAFSVNDITSRRIAEYYPDPTGADEPSSDDAGVEYFPYYADWVDLGAVHHDLVPMADGTLLGLSTTEHPVPAERRAELCPGDDEEWNIFSDVIMHVEPDGTVLRTWDLYDILSFDDHPGEFLCNVQGLSVTPTRRDWSHANAMWFDAERDAILVSSRHTDQIVALAMTDETGPQTGVRWILGNDATMPYDGESFHHTHGVKTVSNGDILFYDNGNFRPGTLSAGGTDPNYSRAVRVRVDDSSDDPSEWTATQVWDHRMIDPVTDELLYAPFISDADELANGNILVTHGGAAVDPNNFLNSHVHVVEIVPDAENGGDEGGDIVWQLSLGDAEESVSMYRADRWETLYFGALWADG